MWHVSLCIIALVVVGFTHWVYRWRNPKCDGNLPPGSMGWPLIGETFQFFTHDRTTWDITSFIKRRMERYGSIFKTSFIGLPVIVSADADLNYMIFQTEGQLFQGWYPDIKLFGNVSFLQAHHKFIKKMVINQFGPESIKNMLSEIESVIISNIERWGHQGTVELKSSAEDMIFEFTSRKLISYDSDKSCDNIMENYDAFTNGLTSLPLAIPGTRYYKCLQGRNKILRMLKDMLKERTGNPNKVKKDFFDNVIEEMKGEGSIFTKAIVPDFMFAVLFASYQPTSIAIVVAMKLLLGNPKALRELTEEHMEILKKRPNSDTRLTWEEYKSMKFTFQVINEAIRLGNLTPGIFRQTLKDVTYKGYTIPSGWVVMVCPPAVHLNPVIYKEPVEFNPWRWEGMGFQGASKNFMAFGGGERFCAGSDITRLQMAVTLHHLVTKYRWQLVKGGEIIRNPGLHFPNGLYVHFTKKDEHKKISN